CSRSGSAGLSRERRETRQKTRLRKTPTAETSRTKRSSEEKRSKPSSRRSTRASARASTADTRPTPSARSTKPSEGRRGGDRLPGHALDRDPEGRRRTRDGRLDLRAPLSAGGRALSPAKRSRRGDGGGRGAGGLHPDLRRSSPRESRPRARAFPELA